MALSGNTRLADVVTPEVFDPYIQEQMIGKSRFWKSGALQINPAISANLAGGGDVFKLPFWKNIGDDTGDAQIPVEGADATINKITSGEMRYKRLINEQHWSSNDLAPSLAGSEPMQAIANNVLGYWDKIYDTHSLAMIEGVIADNILNDSGDLIQIESTIFDDNMVIDAQAKLGENGVLGRADVNFGEWAMIVVRSEIYARMRKDNLISFTPVSGQDRPLGSYMGMEVVVDKLLNDDGVAAPNTLFDTYIVKTGALNWGISNSGAYIQTETSREALQGHGLDLLHTRRQYAIHPIGFQWTDASVAGLSPTVAEFKLAANYDRVFKQENIGLVAVRSKA